MNWSFADGTLTAAVGAGDVITPNGLVDGDLGGSSTFSAWGSEIGALQDFDAIELSYNAFNGDVLPTVGELYIRDGKDTVPLVSVTGIVLDNPTTGVYTIRVPLGTTIANAAGNILFMDFVTDGKIFLRGENPFNDQWVAAENSRYKVNNALGSGGGWQNTGSNGLAGWKWHVKAVKAGAQEVRKEIEIADCHTVEVRRGWDTNNIKLVLELNSVKEEYDIHVGGDTTIDGVAPTDQENAITLLTNLLP